MIGGDGETDLVIDLKASRLGQKDKGGWLEGILWRKQDAAMVDAVLIGRVLGPTHRKVPFE